MPPTATPTRPGTDPEVPPPLEPSTDSTAAAAPPAGVAEHLDLGLDVQAPCQCPNDHADEDESAAENTACEQPARWRVRLTWTCECEHANEALLLLCTQCVTSWDEDPDVDLALLGRV